MKKRGKEEQKRKGINEAKTRPTTALEEVQESNRGGETSIIVVMR